MREANVGFNLVPAMLSGQVDATLGGFWNYEAIQLRLMGKHPTVIPVDQAGVPNYDELVLVVREAQAHTDGQDLRAFMQALTPAASRRFAPIPPRPPRRSPPRTRRWNPSCSWNRSGRRCRRPSRATRASPSAGRTPKRGRRSATWMYAHGLLMHNPDAGLPPFSNEFLPGQGI